MIIHINNYRKYLQKLIKTENKRGYQSALAQVASCQRSYFSQVLKEQAHLSIEQGFRIATHLNFSEIETEYFLTLIDYEKISDISTKNFLRRKLSKAKEEYLNLTKSIKNTKELNNESKRLYYSAWYWSAIHISCSIEKLKTAEDISNFLELPIKLVNKVLETLKQFGLVEKEKSEWQYIARNIHTPFDSPFHLLNVKNWQNKANEYMQTGDKLGTFYLGIHSHSNSDYDKIREILIEAINDIRKIIPDSEGESLSTLNINLFPVGMT